MQTGLQTTRSDSLLAAPRLPARVAIRHSRRHGHRAVTCRAAQPAKNVVVVGAGVGGICLAGRLAKRGFNVTVVEKNPEVTACGHAARPLAYRDKVPAGIAARSLLTRFEVMEMSLFNCAGGRQGADGAAWRVPL